MPIAITVMALVGSLCALDLILTYGVIRRLREHTKLLSELRGAGGGAPALPEGSVVGDFTTSSVDAELVGPAALPGETLVGFFSPGCGPCVAMLPRFVEYARAVPGGRDRVLGVVVGESGEADEFVHDLREVARVVVETHEGPVSTAFQVRAYPTVLKVAPDDEQRLVVTKSEVNLDRAPVMA
jgi:thiol-disulfide isomerase/thioredoxin